MTQDDYLNFHDAWLIAHELSSSNKEPSDGAVMKAFDMLSKYPVEKVLNAIDYHSKKTAFAPTPANIIELLESKRRRPTPEEAWGLCPKNECGGTYDYEATVVWTEEIMAAYEAARPLLREKDKVGGRMAFKAAYERLCLDADIMQKPTKWIVSLGFDKTEAIHVIQNAVTKGFISASHAQRMLPAPIESGPIGKLLTNQSVGDVSQYKENWAKIKKAFGDATGLRVSSKPVEKLSQDEFNDRKQQLIQMLKEKGVE